MAAGDDRTMDHAELAQVSVLPVDHVQVRYTTGSRNMRSTASHQSCPPQSVEEGGIPDSDTPESVHGAAGMLTLKHTSQPHYS